MTNKVKILKAGKYSFWAKKGEVSYSRDVKELLDYLGVDYDIEYNGGERDER
ncbi:hypothetical protein KAI04_04135 [Candidatus Pacearchaeota archaeon]|nr:hypothetical protein [Candidatus Pacearchaeota archaeon]